MSRKFIRTTGFRFLALLLVATFLILQPLAAGASAAKEYRALGALPGSFKSSFSFLIGTDSHIGHAPAAKNTQLAFQDMMTRFGDASFMIHMGDLTETGALEQYRELADLLSPLPFPLIATMGNHESRWQDPQGAIFNSFFGSQNTSFNYGAWHFVVLNTSYPGETLGTLDPAIVSWLEEDLAANPGRPIAIFSHHPLLYLETKFQDSDAVFAGIMDKYPVRAVFSGHGHSFIMWQAQGQRFEMVGALMDGAYAEVSVNGLEMTVTAVAPDQEGVYQEKVEWSATVPVASAILPGNPVGSLEVSAESGTLTGVLNLSRAAEVYAQIDNGYFFSLGNMTVGSNPISIDVSGYAKGLHTFTVKSIADGPYFYTVEFGKDALDWTLWQRDLGSAVVGDMVAKGTNDAIVGTRDGLVRAIALADGSVTWTFDALSPWGGGVLDGNRLYFGTAAGDFYCLNALDGSLVWKVSPVDPMGLCAAPVIASTKAGKLAIVPSASGKVYGLNALFGGKVWQHEVSGAVVSTPTVLGDKVFFGSWDCHFYALESATGTRVWDVNLARQVYYAPYLAAAAFGDTVYVGTVYDVTVGGSWLYALDVTTGGAKWKAQGTSSFMAPSVSAGRPVTVMDASGTVWAFSQVDGSVEWSRAGSSTLFGDPVGAGPHFVTGGYRGVLGFIGNEGKADLMVRDSHLFVTPLIFSAPGADSASVLTADTRGSLLLLRFPE